VSVTKVVAQISFVHKVSKIAEKAWVSHWRLAGRRYLARRLC